MKNLFWAPIALSILGLGLAGCGSGENADEENGGAAEADPDFPQRDIELVVPYGPGGATDIIFRLIAEGAQEELGQSIVITNMEGGGATIGSRHVKDSEPDGYTILGSHDSIATSYLSGSSDFSFDAFEPISLLTQTINIPTVNSASDFEDANDVIEFINDNPGELSLGIIPGSTDHFFMAQFLSEADIPTEDVSFISYADTGSQVEALLAEDIDFSMLNIPAGDSFYEDGSFHPVGVAHDERLDDLPDTPTLIEQGLEFEHSTNRGIFAPEGTPQEHVDIIAGAFEAALEDEEIIDQINNELGSVDQYLPPEEYAEYLEELEGTLTELSEDIEFEE